MAYFRRALLAASVAVAAASCGGGDDDKAPAAGTEGGACFPNGTCNAALTCASNLCVRVGGAGGGAATGGVPGGGGAAPAAGAAGATNPGSGGAPSGGAVASSGGSVASSGGAGAGGGTASGGSATCTNTTNDPENCGACGHQCRRHDPSAPVGDANACSGGHCAPSFAECFKESEFASCNDYCASIGETCSENACSLSGVPTTWIEWGADRNRCLLITLSIASGDTAGACAQKFAVVDVPPDPNNIFRCCCTDTK